MKTNGKTLYSQLKRILRRIPMISIAYATLRRLYASSIEIDELSSLIKENRMVVLRPYFMMGRNRVVTHKIVRDVVQDYVKVYGTVRPGRTKAAVPAGAVLLGHPLALLRIPLTHEEYLKLVGAKTRNMIRKAERQGYEFKEFVWNDHLHEIFNINTSKEVRSSGVMCGWYRELVKPRYYNTEEQYYLKYYGAFKEGKLLAYVHIVLCGDHAFFRHFIGHAEHLTYGIMNGLISWTVREYVGNPQVRWFKYGTLHERSMSSAASFRKHAGFKGYATFLDLEDDHELSQFSQSIGVRSWRDV